MRESELPSLTQDAVNRAWYGQGQAVAVYGSDDQLEPSLVLLLVKYRDSFLGRPVLDIGIGAGRTTFYLSRFAKGYVGIDYSEAMVTHCRSRFPGLQFEVCDARDLGRFSAGSFSLAVFSFNGIGTIDHEGRKRTLAEIARVLEPGGIYAFSAHNRGYAAARVGPRLRRSRNPLTQAQLVFDWLRKTRNHARLRPFESDQPEYALVNDQAEGFTLLHYYIAKDEQRRQLERAGLDLVEMYDKSGNPIAVDGSDQHTPWIWYVARKPGGSVSRVR